MKKDTRTFYFLFIPTLLFLLVFPALYYYYDIHISTRFEQNVYEWFEFSPDGKIPDFSGVLFYNITEFLNVIACIVISLVFSRLSAVIMKRKYSRLVWIHTIFIAVLLTLLLALLYFIYIFLRYKIENDFIVSFVFELTAPQAKLLAVLYFIIVMPIVAIVEKRRFV